MKMNEVKKIKLAIREEIWKKMEKLNITTFPRPVYGRIPNFVGSEIAAEKVSKLQIFNTSNVIFCNPDAPQRHVRYLALLKNKIVIMATPRLKKGFLVIKPNKLNLYQKKRASTIKGAFQYGILSDDLSDFYIPLKVTGSVAVTLDGARLGKGGGYSDLEFAILREMGSIDDKTLVVTTVHRVQIVDKIPMTKHDVPTDYVITPESVHEIREKRYDKPKGIYWDELDSEKIEQIPLLRKFKR